MEKNIYEFQAGDFSVRYSLRYKGTLRYFDQYLRKTDSLSSDIEVSDEYIDECNRLIFKNENKRSYQEFSALMVSTGNHLLAYQRALFHGAALLWNDQAWIFTAPSGTGKTTQLLHWNEILKDEMTIINGDKPLLECRDDGSVYVYSSPWRGKEKYGTPGIIAPLAGIILLQQGQQNIIQRMKPEDAVIPLFTEFVSYPQNTDQIKNQADILTRILNTVPVWKLINRGDQESALLTLNTVRNSL